MRLRIGLAENKIVYRVIPTLDGSWFNKITGLWCPVIWSLFSYLEYSITRDRFGLVMR